MKPQYTKPQARDLGGYRSMLASGQWDGPPMPGMPGAGGSGIGDSLTGWCRTGSLPSGMACTPTGNNPAFGSCNQGSTPQEYCSAGGAVTSNPAPCNPVGQDPNLGRCLNGLNVLNLCTVGSFVQIS